MSTLLAGALTAKREDAEEGTSTTVSPGVKPYVDGLATLVPAEVLAISAVVLQFCVKTTDDKKTTTISQPTTLKYAFVALLILSVVLFLASRSLEKDKTKKAPSLLLLCFQCAIPPLAFIGWSMLQPVSAIDVIYSGLDSSARQVIAIIGSAFLAAAAVALGYKLDAEKPKEKDKGAE